MLHVKQMQDFHGQMNVLKGEIERWKKSHYSIVFLGTDEERVKKLEHILVIMILMQTLRVDRYLLHGKFKLCRRLTCRL